MSGRMIEVANPRTGAVDYRFDAVDEAGLSKLAARLRAAQGQWAARTIEDRCEALLGWADSIDRHKDAIAAALETDTGRRRIARLEVEGAIASIRGWAAGAPHLLPQPQWAEGRMNPAIRHQAQDVPYALTGVISPWNFPLTLSLIDTIPALIAGSAVIVKPSEVTPRFAEPLGAAIAEAGLSDLLAFAPGDGATGAALVDQVDVVCFTGSVPTGKKVAVRAAGRLIPAFLELGGKDPLIILESADMDRAVTAALRGSVLSTGQACQSIERIYVARAIYPDFLDRLVTAAEAVRFNWPDINSGELGPMIFARQADIIAGQLEDAVARGAKVLTGGKIDRHGGGYWIAPTVLTDVTHDMAIIRDETFGPILPVMAFDSVEEAVRLANDTVYGLSAAVIAGTIEEAEGVGRQLDAGAVTLNDAALTALFHEAEKQSFKQSGLGPSRMGAAGLLRFYRRKALIAQTGAPAPLSAFSEG
ncbi:MAG: aldehyde dehydrogenase family protein [Oceanicaulis sp.]|uniref:aldehyde dehydrogenase family protein n=1 Tax=Glycocaulis sp. TaxID=1969725 RepID=UPI0025B8F582|nr:aldehyde dehydrogenase family protein [Glycocaulis sp.]MCC5980915.1 aldehyde dehydrogenase family protein [Oceanicaulis sp.]MCH8521666.1 aldehyde dehydrogenase family protein [Glycocaulis sp.]